MKAIIITILAGCFLLGAVALRAYMTPIFGEGAPEGRCFISRYGHVYLLAGPPGGVMMIRIDEQGKWHFCSSDGKDIVRPHPEASKTASTNNLFSDLIPSESATDGKPSVP
jgi:hypothetical protein